MGKAVKDIATVAVGVGLFFVGGGSGQLIARSIGANLLLGEAAKMLGPKPPKNRVVPQTVTARGSNLPGTIVYGEVRSAGMLYIPIPGTSGQGQKYLHYVIVLAAHEVESIGTVWLDTDEVTIDALDGSGAAISGKFSGKLLIERFLGTSDQVASTVLTDAITRWGSDFYGRGVSYLHVRMERDDEVFPQGPPQNIFAMVKGRKVYDPRTGSTAWSDNPALCLRDYLVTYCGGQVDETLVAAAANICDELVTVPSGTQKRYRCSGVLSTGADPAGNISDLLSAMNGAVTFAKGKFRMFAGAYDAPTLTIDESWLAGALSVQLQTPGDKIYNTVRGEYIDPNRNYQAVEHELITNATYVTLDGRSLEQQVAYPFTNDEYQAQRQSYQRLLQSRGQRSLTVPLNLKGLSLHAWDTVTVNLPRFGINEVYRVADWKWGDTSPITVILKEESAGYYQAPTYLTPTTVDQIGSVEESPSMPDNLTIVPGTGGNQLTWTNPPARQFDQIEIWRSPDSDFANAELIAAVRASSYFDIVTAASTPFYWIRARNASGQYSDYIPEITSSGSGGGTAPEPPGGGALFAALSATSIYRSRNNGDPATTASVTCTASGGTSPYTYLWTRVSGSTDITALTSTSATTAFYAAGASDISKTSTWKCTVTDSESPENVVDSATVSVTITWQDRDDLTGI